MKELFHPMINDFHLTKLDAALMDNYYILHWNASWFQKQYADSGVFKRDGVSYIVLFADQECKALHRETLEVALSFRYCKKVNNLHGYCIAKKVK